MRRILRVAAGVLLWAVLLVLVEPPGLTPGQFLALGCGLAVAVWLLFKVVPLARRVTLPPGGG